MVPNTAMKSTIENLIICLSLVVNFSAFENLRLKKNMPDPSFDLILCFSASKLQIIFHKKK
jgi:hypothetical protein